MERFIGCDAHKKYSVFVAVNEKGQAGEALRVAHERELYREFLTRLPAHSEIAIEASGSYSWLVDEMERSGHRPRLCNPLEAKRRMGLTNKTDKLDARGLAILLRNGTRRKCGYRGVSCAINASCCASASSWCACARG
jgi:transposase